VSILINTAVYKKQAALAAAYARSTQTSLLAKVTADVGDW